jgi:hypothetical protein
MKYRPRRIVEQALFDSHHGSVDRGAPRRSQPARCGSEPVVTGTLPQRVNCPRWAGRTPGVLDAGQADVTYLELVASLAAHQAPVTAAERDELIELLEAMGMPTDSIGKLNVQS